MTSGIRQLVIVTSQGILLLFSAGAFATDQHLQGGVSEYSSARTGEKNCFENLSPDELRQVAMLSDAMYGLAQQLKQSGLPPKQVLNGLNHRLSEQKIQVRYKDGSTDQRALSQGHLQVLGGINTAIALNPAQATRGAALEADFASVMNAYVAYLDSAQQATNPGALVFDVFNPFSRGIPSLNKVYDTGTALSQSIASFRAKLKSKYNLSDPQIKAVDRELEKIRLAAVAVTQSKGQAAQDNAQKFFNQAEAGALAIGVAGGLMAAGVTLSAGALVGPGGRLLASAKVVSASLNSASLLGAFSASNMVPQIVGSSLHSKGTFSVSELMCNFGRVLAEQGPEAVNTMLLAAVSGGLIPKGEAMMEGILEAVPALAKILKPQYVGAVFMLPEAFGAGVSTVSSIAMGANQQKMKFLAANQLAKGVADSPLQVNERYQAAAEQYGRQATLDGFDAGFKAISTIVGVHFLVNGEAEGAAHSGASVEAASASPPKLADQLSALQNFVDTLSKINPLKLTKAELATLSSLGHLNAQTWERLKKIVGDDEATKLVKLAQELTRWNERNTPELSRISDRSAVKQTSY